MRYPLFLALLASASLLAAQVRGREAAPDSTAVFNHAIGTEKKPWTHLNFQNDPDHFQFAIVSDNTGGMRPGVFESAVVKLNLMQPEFVMSVGDLIEGYTDKQVEIDSEWVEFNGWAQQLEMPFFYLPGNHDISNATMQRDWENRYGVRYYSFVYKNVLFICMDTDDKDRPEWYEISDAQADYVIKALDDHPDVRWTFFFMHHPMWPEESKTFARIEERLAQGGRKYTMFAGHTHRYMHNLRQGRHYYTLATTGGGSALLGPEWGTFDHITWVTVKDEEPVMANLWLDGILDMDLVNESSQSTMAAVEKLSKFPVRSALDRKAGLVQAAELELVLENSGSDTLLFNLAFLHHHQLLIEPARQELALAPASRQVVRMALRAMQPLPLEQLDLLDLLWSVQVARDDLRPLLLRGTRTVDWAERTGKP
jgi:hypothetical protein